jgi:ribosome-associated protein
MTSTVDRREYILESIDIGRKIVEIASDKQADEIVLLDTRNICSFTDYFVICSGDSDRQIEAIREEISKALKKEGVITHHSEGTAESGWVLLDLGNVIVHIFSPQQRNYYQLDDLWSNAAPVIRIQ